MLYGLYYICIQHNKPTKQITITRLNLIVVLSCLTTLFFSIFPSISDVRLTNKELPTTKWRRERRIRLSAEYQQTSPTNAAAVAAASAAAAASGVRPLGESNGNSHLMMAAESPLDMSAKPPPPPYREPLPGSQFAHHLARPSVIVTQAPKQHDVGPAAAAAALNSPGTTAVSESVSPAIAAVSPSPLPPAYATASNSVPANAATAASAATVNGNIF